MRRSSRFSTRGCAKGVPRWPVVVWRVWVPEPVRWSIRRLAPVLIRSVGARRRRRKRRPDVAVVGGLRSLRGMARMPPATAAKSRPGYADGGLLTACCYCVVLHMSRRGRPKSDGAAKIGIGGPRQRIKRSPRRRSPKDRSHYGCRQPVRRVLGESKGTHHCESPKNDSASGVTCSSFSKKKSEFFIQSVKKAKAAVAFHLKVH